MYPPYVLVHVVIASQPPLSVAHSSMSVHPASPPPVKPSSHSPHLKLPGVFAHTALASQPPLSVAHSSMSTQPLVPSPV